MKYKVLQSVKNTDLTKNKIVELSEGGFLYCKGYCFPFYDHPVKVKISPEEIRVMVASKVLLPVKVEQVHQSVADLKKEARDKYKTNENTMHTFEVGNRVRVITPCSDFFFFHGDEEGIVTKLHDYGTITVTFDPPLKMEKGGGFKTSHGFEPQDLLKL